MPSIADAFTWRRRLWFNKGMQPNSPYQPAPSPEPPHPPEYGFIMDPQKPSKRGLPQLPSGMPPGVKIAVIAGGILAVLIIFVILRGIFGGAGNDEAFLTVVEDQQELIYLAEKPGGTSTQTAVLSSANQDFAVTAETTLISAQSQLLAYLKDNGQSINQKDLAKSVSATNPELEAAAQNSSFNSTFKKVMQAKLQDYRTALQQAYKQAKGPKGRQLLSEQYKGAGLLEQQLKRP